MRLSLIKIAPLPEKRHEVLEILQSMKGFTQALAGCLNCSIYVECGEDQGILYLEQWRTAAEMHSHIRSGLYTRLLEGIELSAKVPEVCIYEIGNTWGLELIELVRSPEAERLESVKGDTQKEPS